MRAITRSLRTLETVLGLSLLLAVPGIAIAQDKDDDVEPVKEAVETAEETGNIEAEEHGEDRPSAPTTGDSAVSGDTARIATGAGMGSDLAFASQSVVELGGSLALTHASQTTTFRIAPVLGYFIFDNLELSLFPELSVVDIDGNSDVVVGVMVEPSYHVAFSDALYGFAGFGVGLRYSDDPGADFALRPRVGMDVMVGRSGILKPAFFIDIGANDGLTQGGFEASFTVML
jgi:hypothetical protein